MTYTVMMVQMSLVGNGVGNMRLKIFSLFFILFLSFVLGNEKFIFIECSTSRKILLTESLLIEEGEDYIKNITRKYKKFRDYAVFPQIDPGFPGKTKSSYIPLIELKVKKKTFEKLFDLCKDTTAFAPFVRYGKNSRDIFAKKVILGWICTWQRCLIVTISDGKVVKQIFLDAPTALFFLDSFYEVLKEVPEKIRNKYWTLFDYRYYLKWQTFYERYFEPILAFTIQMKFPKVLNVFCPIGKKITSVINNLLNYMYFEKIPVEKKFFWGYEKVKDIKKVTFKYGDRKIINLLNRIRIKNREKGIFISNYTPCAGEGEIKLDKDEILLSVVLRNGVEYYKVNRSDEDVRKLLNTVLKKLVKCKDEKNRKDKKGIKVAYLKSKFFYLGFVIISIFVLLFYGKWRKSKS